MENTATPNKTDATDSEELSAADFEAVKERITELAPQKGDDYVAIQEAYAMEPDAVRDALPDRKPAAPRTFAIEHIAKEHPSLVVEGDIDSLARLTIVHTAKHEAALREAALDEESPDPHADLTADLVGLYADTLKEFYPYQYREEEQYISDQLERLAGGELSE